ncbi:MAG TPA: uroporphyrinogen decarboxylase family protein [Anaerolineae bacterium]|nr:uroporphyrinogen decarboxylase family protein [Anaerolineae bacterium]
MDSRERVRQALDHKEADRVPFDLGGTGLTTIHVDGYRRLRDYLGLPPVQVQIMAQAEQLAVVDEDVARRLDTDVRLLLPGLAHGFEYVVRAEGEYDAYTDEWGIGWRKPQVGGFYYDMYRHPLSGAQSLSDVKAHHFPDPLDPGRFATLREQAEAARAKGKATALAGPCAGVLEVYSWMRGYEGFYIDLAANQEMVGYALDQMVDFKCAYWEKALAELDGLVDVVIEADDMAGQQSLLLSPRTYRKLIKPRHHRLFDFIKAQAPVRVFFHSCGAVVPLIPDLIEAGVDILNPVQKSATGMDLTSLKREFGRDLVFWGGGVDTQRVLGDGTPEEVRQDVKANVEALAPGGGFVFAAIHDIQPNVPPENVMAMWEAWREFGAY